MSTQTVALEDFQEQVLRTLGDLEGGPLARAFREQAQGGPAERTVAQDLAAQAFRNLIDVDPCADAGVVAVTALASGLELDLETVALVRRRSYCDERSDKRWYFTVVLAEVGGWAFSDMPRDEFDALMLAAWRRAHALGMPIDRVHPVSGRTPATQAIDDNDFDVAALLVQLGVDPERRDGHGACVSELTKGKDDISTSLPDFVEQQRQALLATIQARLVQTAIERALGESAPKSRRRR